MKLENQLTSLELSKKLKELGVKQESLWYYFRPLGSTSEFSIGMEIERDDEVFSAFTVAELGEKLPRWFNIEKGDRRWYVNPNIIPETNIPNFHYQADKNLANAMALMLCYLIENKLIKP